MITLILFYIVGTLPGGEYIRLAATRLEADEQAARMILAGAKNVQIKRIG